MSDLLTIGNLFNLVLIIFLALGGFFALKRGKQNTLTTTQEQTINALQSRQTAMEGRITDLEKENARQQMIIELMTAAMKQKGFLVTIDGEMITISEQKSRSSTTIKRRPSTPALKKAKAESEQAS